MRQQQQAFDDWKRRADEPDLLETAIKYGATLKRVGREHVGPCPACGGTNRFSVNVIKHKWNCRGHGGGRGPINMVVHIAGLSFLQACEELTGEPCPTGKAKPLSPAEQAARARICDESAVKQRRREAQEHQYQEDTRSTARAIWASAKPIDGTLAQSYLMDRGIPAFESGAVRFHPSLLYPNGKNYPALVARVDDMVGEVTAVWRIFLRADGRKADVDNAKLGIGPAAGGAVRIGGVGKRIGVAEGVETALAAWHLMDKRFPVWAALSTAGMTGLELPLGVEQVCIFPDGDRPLRKRGHEYEPATPAGRKAAETLRERLIKEGIVCTIASEPGPGRDYLDIWNDHCREVA
jgi:putative DNA primase/helicase